MWKIYINLFLLLDKISLVYILLETGFCVFMDLVHMDRLPVTKVCRRRESPRSIQNFGALWCYPFSLNSPPGSGNVYISSIFILCTCTIAHLLVLGL